MVIGITDPIGSAYDADSKLASIRYNQMLRNDSSSYKSNKGS